MSRTSPGTGLSGLFRARARAFYIALALVAVSLVSAAPAPGTGVINQAGIGYRNARLDLFERLLSNPVRAVVAPGAGFDLRQDLTVSAPPGATVALAYRLTQTGNLPASFGVAIEASPADDFDLMAARIVVDLDGDGVADGLEPVFGPADTIALAPGESIALLLVGVVPVGAVAGSVADHRVIAEDVATGQVADALGRVIVVAASAVALSKAADRTSASAGEIVRFTLVAHGVGNATTTPIPISVDGVPRFAVVLRDAIPLNTALVGVVTAALGQPLYHRAGDAFHAYLTAPTADPGQVDAVAVGVDMLSAGQDLVAELSVRVLPAARIEIDNVAFVHHEVAGGEQATASNTVRVALPGDPSAMDYYASAAFDAVVRMGHTGAALHVQALAGGCNLDPSLVESYAVELVAATSGDRESSFVAIESGPNTGAFRVIGVPTRPWPENARVEENGILEAARNDEVLARLTGCPEVVLEARIVLDATGLVYDSRHGQPIGGVQVTLVAVDPGGGAFAPAVANPDGSPAPATVTTAADGAFRFPVVPAGSYRLEVVPSAGYTFPSALPPDLQPTARRVDPSGSYGGEFEVPASAPSIAHDVPLDPSGAVDPAGLFVEKRASRTIVELGDAFTYEVEVFNGTQQFLAAAFVLDRLPPGFGYEPGTARLDGVRIDDPEGVPGPDLRFSIGDLAVGARRTLRYAVVVGPGSIGRTAINAAWAEAGGAQSNIASARVEVEAGVFADETFVLGKIFVDCNRNHVQDAEDLGIPGVRLFLEDGTFVVSDSEGKYSFFGLAPRTHVLRIDRASLPEGAVLVPLANRAGGDPYSRFVDAKKGELHRADFAEGSCRPEILERVRTRRAAGEALESEIDGPLAGDLRLERGPLVQDVRSRPASGVVGRDGRITAELPLFDGQELGPETSVLADAPVRPVPTADPAAGIEELDAALGFVDLAEGDVVAGTQISVRVKGKAGATLRLAVNGQPVPETRIGSIAQDPARGVQVVEFVAVVLDAGENELTVIAADPFGNPRGEARVRVRAPGSAAQLALALPEDDPPADGQTRVAVVVRLADAEGIAVTSRTPVTLEVEPGRWDVADADPRQPGVQTFITGGKAAFGLVAPAEPGEVLLRVTSGTLLAKRHLRFAPDLRPLVAVGVIEGALSLDRLGENALDPATAADGFEERIENVDFENGDLSGGARGAVYLKGKIRGDVLLTLAYDTESDSRERLFRDIEPDEFYPVYGDDSIKGFDAQSTGRLYVRLDRGRSYLLYGDFNTARYDEARRLGDYSRSLNGAWQHFESGPVSVDLFAAEEQSRQVVVDIPARGVSGPYDLGRTDIVVGSEKVEILTRDRNQPAIVLATVPQTRFRDYEVDSLGGSLLFRAPVPSFDSQLNPNFVRVTFEVDGAGDESWVWGVDTRVRLGERVGIGAAVARDDKDVDPYELTSAHVTAELGENTDLVGEIARSESDTRGSGDARRLELRHSSAKVDARLFGATADEDFDNPNAGLAPGRLEAGGRATWRATEKTRVVGEALYSRDRADDGVRRGVLATVQRDLGEAWRVESGVRWADETTEPAVPGSAGTTPRDMTSLRARVDWRPQFFRAIGTFAEYEQDVGDDGGRVAAVGGDWQLEDRGRLYLRHELLSSLSGPYGVSADASTNHNTVFGVDADYMTDGRVFSEYRVRDAISGREAEAAIGLRNVWVLSPGLRAHTTFERVQPVSGDRSEATAVSGAIEATANPLWKTTARLELRRSESTESVLQTVGLARKLDRDWTLLAKNTYAWSLARTSDLARWEDRLRFGLAYRDTDTNRTQALGRYELKFEDDEATGRSRLVHLWSAHSNWQPVRAWVLSGRYAGKFADERGTTGGFEEWMHLLGGRVTHDLSERWDLGLVGSGLQGGPTDGLRFGLGLETGFLIQQDLWLSVGYNWLGYEDEDLTELDKTNPGVYLRLRFKFGEELFRWLE